MTNSRKSRLVLEIPSNPHKSASRKRSRFNFLDADFSFLMALCQSSDHIFMHLRKRALERHMRHHSYFRLPDDVSWRFDQISASDPDRASVLEKAGPPSALLTALQNAFEAALTAGNARLGREQRQGEASLPDDYRGVVQFPVGSDDFDWFFNARTGYRAHFRMRYEFGLSFNEQIIEVLRRCLDTLPDIVFGRLLNGAFEDCGPEEIPKLFLTRSLEPALSKVWFCTKLI